MRNFTNERVDQEDHHDRKYCPPWELDAGPDSLAFRSAMRRSSAVSQLSRRCTRTGPEV